MANKEEHKAKVIVITGDLVDDGSLGQYRIAKRQIDVLKNNGFEVLAAPGNHDYGSNGIIESKESVKMFKRYISGDIDYPYIKQIDNHYFIILDSMLHEMKERELWGAQGELGNAQQLELNRELDYIENNDKNAKVVIAMHHHPFFYNHFLKLRDDELFKDIIIDKNAGKSRVDCLLFGHKHDEKRFTKKEKEYNIGTIFSSGSTTERDDNGKMTIPVIDIDNNSIKKYYIKKKKGARKSCPCIYKNLKGNKTI